MGRLGTEVAGVRKGGPHKHGTTYGYNARGCRCLACTKARSVYMKSWRAGKRALQAEIGGPTRSKPPPDPVPQPKWTGEEPCVTAPDKDVFHVDTPEAESEAKAYCAGCPILAECLQYSLDAVEEGIWGGTTTLEREELRA